MEFSNERLHARQKRLPFVQIFSQAVILRFHLFYSHSQRCYFLRLTLVSRGERSGFTIIECLHQLHQLHPLLVGQDARLLAFAEQVVASALFLCPHWFSPSGKVYSTTEKQRQICAVKSRSKDIPRGTAQVVDRQFTALFEPAP